MFFLLLPFAPVTNDLRNLVLKLEGRVSQLESGKGAAAAPAAKAAAKPAADDDDDEDVDLFGSDSDEEENAEKVRIREERLKAYHGKKAKKPALIAKTSVLLDCKPWDDETDMEAMLKEIKTITKEGLVWGASKLVPVGYGINKLQVRERGGKTNQFSLNDSCWTLWHELSCDFFLTFDT